MADPGQPAATSPCVAAPAAALIRAGGVQDGAEEAQFVVRDACGPLGHLQQQRLVTQAVQQPAAPVSAAGKALLSGGSSSGGGWLPPM